MYLKSGEHKGFYNASEVFIKEGVMSFHDSSSNEDNDYTFKLEDVDEARLNG